MTVTTEQRAILCDLQRSINTARVARLARVRSYRNTLAAAVGLLLAAAVVLPIIVPHIAGDIAILRPAPKAGGSPDVLDSGDLLTIEIWGAVGGLVGLVAALRRLVSTKAPMTLQAIQLILKIPAGAVTAVFGTLIFQSGIIASLATDTATQLTAYALVFGFAQEAVTAMVDRQAGELLEQSKTTNEAAAGGDSGQAQ